MYLIKKYDENIACRTIAHGMDVFHRAYADGDSYYHVCRQDGSLYDIEHFDNGESIRQFMPPYVQGPELLPNYRIYDENDTSLMDMELLNAYTAYICKEVTEYSIVVARILLKHTQKDVYFSNDLIYSFIAPAPRLHVNAQLPEIDGALILTGPYGRPFYEKNDLTRERSDITVFHSLLIPQWIFQGKDRSKLKYVTFQSSASSKGIVSLLDLCNRMENYFVRWGLKVVIAGDHIAKYDLRQMRKYFRLNEVPDDMCEENTAFIRGTLGLYASWGFMQIEPELHLDIFSDKLKSDMEEYRQAVFRGRKALGVLIRGTDYHTVGFTGERAMATTAEMIPLIHEWIELYKYDMIFLATEDLDVLKEMFTEFGGMIYAIAQERHTVAEVKKTVTIDALERQLYSPKEYDDRVMETTINYMYALYMLAHCDSLIVSGKSNGVDIARSFNEGKYAHYYQFNQQK